MPMERTEDFGGKRMGNRYCRYCCDENGNLKSREEVRQGMITFRMKAMNETRAQAGKAVDEYMRKMPAWMD